MEALPADADRQRCSAAAGARLFGSAAAMPEWTSAAVLTRPAARPAPTALAVMQAEIEQRLQAEPVERLAVAGLGRDMRQQAVVERGGIGARAAPRPRPSPRSRRASPAPSPCARRGWRRRSPRTRGRRSGAGLPAGPRDARHAARAPRSTASALRAIIAASAPEPGPTQSAPLPPNSAAKIAAATVVLPTPISPMAEQIDAAGDRLHAEGHGGGAAALVERGVLGDIAGRQVSARSKTFRPRSWAMQIWLIAAPPAAQARPGAASPRRGAARRRGARRRDCRRRRRPPAAAPAAAVPVQRRAMRRSPRGGRASRRACPSWRKSGERARAAIASGGGSRASSARKSSNGSPLVMSCSCPRPEIAAA